MQFSNSVWKLFEGIQTMFCGPLPQPITMPFAEILWADILNYRLDQHHLELWGCIWPLRVGPAPKGALPPAIKTVVLIGERVFEGGEFPPFAIEFSTGERLFFRPLHVALKLFGNPLVLDLLWLPNSEPEISIKIPIGKNDLTTAQLSNYTSDLCKEMPEITQYVKPKVGRPKGVEPSPIKFEKMRQDAIRMKGKGNSWESIAEKLGVEDMKTLRRYRKIWGIN